LEDNGTMDGCPVFGPDDQVVAASRISASQLFKETSPSAATTPPPPQISPEYDVPVDALSSDGSHLGGPILFGDQSETGRVRRRHQQTSPQLLALKEEDFIPSWERAAREGSCDGGGGRRHSLNGALGCATVVDQIRR
jgi:hypothetical protein